MAPRKSTKGKAKPKTKKVVAKKGKASQNTKVNASLKVSVNAFLAIGAGGQNTNNYTLGYITALGSFGSNGVSFFNNPDYKSQAALYDEVCIKSYTVKFQPVVTQTNLYDQGFVVPTANQLSIQPNLYTWFDRDASPLTVINAALPNKIAQYDSYKRHSCYKPWIRTMYMKPVWLSCDKVAGGSHLTSEATTQLTQAGLLGNFGIYGQNLPWGGSINAANEAYGQLQVTWSFVFRGKRPIDVQVDENGIVTLTPASLFAPIIQTLYAPPVSDMSGNRLSLDASGIPIEILP